MPGEIPGPGPEETGAAAPEAPASTPTEETRRRRWYWPFGGRERTEATSERPAGAEEELARREAELEEQRREAERRGGEPVGGAERVEHLARSRTAEGLVQLMTVISAEQFRELKLNEKHGTGRIGALRKFLAGERDFDLTADGQTRRVAWKELWRKGLATFANRKTVLAAGTLGVIGILTGGVGLPAAGAMFGAIAGRGAAEAWESIRGEERGLREEIAKAHYDQWFDLRNLALRAQDESLTDDERAEAMRSLVEGFHRTSEPVAEREEEIQEVRKRWDRRRGILSSIGAVAGLGAGFWAGFQGLTEVTSQGAQAAHEAAKPLYLDLDADGIAHQVAQIDGVWHFAYKSAEEMAQAKAAAAAQHLPLTIEHAGLGGASGWHILGPDASKIPAELTQHLSPGLVKSLPTLAQKLFLEGSRVAAVFAGLGLGAIWARHAEAGRAEDEEREQERLERRQQEARERLLGQIPAVEAPAPVATPEETLASNQERYLAISREQGKSLPDVGQIWIYTDFNGPGIIKITNIDWQNGDVLVDQLNRRDYNEALARDQKMSIEDLLRRGREIVEDWLLTVKDGDEIEISANLITDRSDPKAPKVEAGEYKFKKLEQKPGQAELAIKGKRKPIVDILDLALAGVRPIEKSREERGGEMPRANEIWGRKEDVEVNDLPANLREISRVGIAEVRGNRAHCFKVNEQGRREGAIIKVNLDVLRTYFEYDEPLPRGGGGGGAGGRGGGGGEAGGGGRRRERE